MSSQHKEPLLVNGEAGEAEVDPAQQSAQFEEQLLLEADAEKGLSDTVAAQRLQEWGPNELKDEETNVVLKFLSYFWGPMPIMIWLAIIVEMVKGIITNDGWEDFGVLLVLQIVNGVVGFIEEQNAGNAIAALKEKLKPECWVVRHGSDQQPRHEKIKASDLVPGDVIDLKLGDVIPADCILLGDPEDPRVQLQVDESALTGESLPRTVYARQKLKMSASVKMGEQQALVVATGANTFYGKAASLMNIETHGRFQKILFKITLALLVLSLILCGIIFTILLVSNDQGSGSSNSHSSKVLNAISIVVVLLVASIPIAMQVVCTSTMAVGSRRLADKKVIVARLSAIEELAGMTVLCSDKTGTLTKNELTLNDPRRFGDMEEDELRFMGALSTARTSQNMDAIDSCILHSVPSENDGVTTQWTKERLNTFETLWFDPFNPVSKRTEVLVRAPNGDEFRVCKGAPQVVLRMALENPETDPSLEQHVSAAIQDLADRGYRSLGLAVSYTGEDETPQWRFQALLSLYDPPRDDTMETIKLAVNGGVEVKMVTGDQKAIAVETCRQLDMGTEIFTTEQLDNPNQSKEQLLDRIVKSNGFAEVMPEHKFNIVQALRESGLVVGMTGDGVNDAPALKRADIGIAVEGSTDAAKAAADIVLVEPGLSVIIDAILRSRKIFQRMRNYAIYRIACTIQLLFFFFFAIIAVHPSSSHFYGSKREEDEYPHCKEGQKDFDGDNDPWEHGGAFVLPVIAIVVITILNDGTIITISHDKVIPANSPQRWDLMEVTVIAAVLGLVACMGSMVLLVESLQANCKNPGSFFGKVLGGHNRHFVTYGEVQTIMYLKISLSDFLTVFAGRTRTFFWERRPGYALASAFVFATTCSTILSLFWPFRVPQGVHYKMWPLRHNAYSVLTVWVYCLLWFIVQDIMKFLTYKGLALVWSDNEERMRDVTARAQVTKMMTEDDRMQSRRGGQLVREQSVLRREASQLRGGVAAMEDRMQQMEQEIRQLRSLLQHQQPASSNGSGAAGGRSN